MTAAQLQQEDFANRTRMLAPAYQVEDLVWLSTKNIRTTRPSKKLDHKNKGPFQIKKKMSAQAYELELPDSIKIHLVFHTSLLQPVVNDPLPGQIEPPPPPVITEQAKPE